MFNDFFRNKSILITGHTGFKGSWLALWLKRLGAKLVGYALEPQTKNDNFVVCNLKDDMTHITGDVRDLTFLRQVFKSHRPEFVFHFAAQALVKESYIVPKETLDINVGGTVNVLECCRTTDSVKVIINVTSDKCYENKELARGYTEKDKIGGYDPYSASKGCSELITAAYINSYFNPCFFEGHRKVLSSVRAGNVIGGGDWQKDRLIPDSIRALKKNEPILLRNPYSIRPWQFVLEPLWGYLLLASKMWSSPRKYSGPWNFGPAFESGITVSNMTDFMISTWGEGNWEIKPTMNQPKETNCLRLDSSKAISQLGWFPVWDIEKTVAATIEWYRDFESLEPKQLCLNQIEMYSKDLLQKANMRK